ncbi:MAG: MATE family efflux transporter [Acidobacteriota bacterium]|nr:MATE family efflux transporter [Acidobacteriota bacterium]
MRRLDSHEMGTGKILPTLVTLGLPAAAGGVMQTLFEVADTLFVSRLGKEQISGVGLIGPVMFTAFAVSQAVNVGIAASVSRHLGAKEPDKARDIVNHGLVISLVVGAALTLLLLLLLEPILRWMGGDHAIIEYSRQYAGIMFAGIFMMHLGAAADGALRAQGNTVSPMKIGIISNVANIILDWYLIFGLGWGVRGAAVATVLTRSLMALALLARLCSRESEVRPGRVPGMTGFWRWPVVVSIYWLGLPASIGMAAMSLSMVFINALMVTINPFSVGMLAIAFRIEGFAFTPVFGLFSAVVPMVGYNLGSGAIQRCRATIWTAAGLAATLMGAVGAIIFAFPAFAFGVFTRDAELLPMGVEYLRVQMPVYPLIGASIMMSAGYQGLGMTWMAMLSHLLRNIVLKVPMAYWFAAAWGLTGVWWSFPASTVVTAVIFVWAMYVILERLDRRHSMAAATQRELPPARECEPACCGPDSDTTDKL